MTEAKYPPWWFLSQKNETKVPAELNTSPNPSPVLALLRPAQLGLGRLPS